jgi:cytoskeleton protein RodZ
MIRGVSIEQAARDTRFRTGQLRALEDERFDDLPGEVFVRGALRTYAGYLGLSPDKVLEVYGSHADDPEPPAPPARQGPIERAMAATRIRDNQRFLLILALIVLGIFVAVGLVSRRSAGPPPAPIDTSTPTVATTAPAVVEVELVGLARTTVTITVDGRAETFGMRPDETRGFSGSESIALRVEDGSAIRLSVNGRDFGVPGQPGIAWEGSFVAIPEGPTGAGASGVDGITGSPSPAG